MGEGGRRSRSDLSVKDGGRKAPCQKANLPFIGPVAPEVVENLLTSEDMDGSS